MVLHGRNTTAATKTKNDRPKRIEDRRSSHYYDVKNSPEPHHEVPINKASNYKETHNIYVMNMNTLGVEILIDHML